MFAGNHGDENMHQSVVERPTYKKTSGCDMFFFWIQVEDTFNSPVYNIRGNGITWWRFSIHQTLCWTATIIELCMRDFAVWRQRNRYSRDRYKSLKCNGPLARDVGATLVHGRANAKWRWFSMCGSICTTKVFTVFPLYKNQPSAY